MDAMPVGETFGKRMGGPWVRVTDASNLSNRVTTPKPQKLPPRSRRSPPYLLSS